MKRIAAVPDIAATHIPEGEATISFAQRECNWLQGLEGDIDTSHLNFLHYGSMGGGDFTPTDPTRFGAVHRDPQYKIDETELGTIYGAYRPAENGQTYWRIARLPRSRGAPMARGLPHAALRPFRPRRRARGGGVAPYQAAALGPCDRLE